MKISRYKPTSCFLDLSEAAATKLKMSRNPANLKLKSFGKDKFLHFWSDLSYNLAKCNQVNLEPLPPAISSNCGVATRACFAMCLHLGYSRQNYSCLLR